MDYELVKSYNLSVRVTDDGLGNAVSRGPPTLYDRIFVTVNVLDEPDDPVVLSVLGGSTFGLSTSGGEAIAIEGRYFGSSRPGKYLGPGGAWVVGSRQINLNVSEAACCALAALWF